MVRVNLGENLPVDFFLLKRMGHGFPNVVAAPVIAICYSFCKLQSPSIFSRIFRVISLQFVLAMRIVLFHNEVGHNGEAKNGILELTDANNP